MSLASQNHKINKVENMLFLIILICVHTIKLLWREPNSILDVKPSTQQLGHSTVVEFSIPTHLWGCRFKSRQGLTNFVWPKTPTSVTILGSI